MRGEYKKYPYHKQYTKSTPLLLTGIIFLGMYLVRGGLIIFWRENSRVFGGKKIKVFTGEKVGFFRVLNLKINRERIRQ